MARKNPVEHLYRHQTPTPALVGEVRALGAAVLPTLQAMADEVLKHPARFVDILREQRDFLSANYETCTEEIENGGHRFGEDLSAADKKALTAFLATL